MLKPVNREPDFSNLASVLEKKLPSRPTLFEFYLNDRLYRRLVGERFHRIGPEQFMLSFDTFVYSFMYAGYDYVSIPATRLSFTPYIKKDSSVQNISLNAQQYVSDRASFDKFEWMDPDAANMDEFTAIEEYLPAKMKVIPFGPGGVLENVIAITGYDNLCMMIYDNEQLVYDLFEKVGTTLLKLYKKVLDFPFVGAIMSNDDWGFNTQTLISPGDLRRFVFPWHKKIVEQAHAAGLYTILHSCGNYNAIIDDIINDMKYDARHSYEDKIVPVEEAYDSLKGRIAVLGGLDMNFMALQPPESIYLRATCMLEKTMNDGGYALGTGNSVPEFIPDENYFAMTKALFDFVKIH